MHHGKEPLLQEVVVPSGKKARGPVHLVPVLSLLLLPPKVELRLRYFLSHDSGHFRSAVVAAVAVVALHSKVSVKSIQQIVKVNMMELKGLD